MLKKMTPEDSLKMWTDRVTELEEALQEAIAALRKLRASAQWSGEQLNQIDKKIDKLENDLVPF